ncbi:hypothetical protein ACG7TL_006266 [Trametes sanguinea]
MSVMNPPARQSTQHTEECQHKRGLAARLRGGGAARDCFLGAIECFLCFECCKPSPPAYSRIFGRLPVRDVLLISCADAPAAQERYAVMNPTEPRIICLGSRKRFVLDRVL